MRSRMPALSWPSRHSQPSHIMALTPTAPASAQASCAGTSLAAAIGGGNVRIPTTSDGSNIFNCELGVGNAGEAVARLQLGLDHCNLHAGLAVDSDYGALTRQAVIKVQAHYGLSQDGAFGPLPAPPCTGPSLAVTIRYAGDSSSEPAASPATGLALAESSH
jgi:peptidoglycan hydrolase-like protein with peptidoglycan-binding domain